MTKYVCNAFSPQMVKEKNFDVVFRLITKDAFDAVKKLIPSAVGHQDTARFLNVEYNRCNVELHYGDTILLAQFNGGRLPEGATELPANITLDYYAVTVVEPTINL